MSNNNLKTAKKSKNDEFYTLMADIEKELRFYTKSFEGKVVYCNCDDYQQSNFYKYFYYNFHYLKLKKLICTGYKADGKGLYAIYDGETEVAGKLNSDGDFRSEECIEYLKQADVVVTNPPFSLFRQYIKQLMDYGKKFIIIGNMNAITYKDIFHYIKNNQLWMGCSLNGTKCSFGVPESYNGNNVYIDDGKRMGKVNNACWFTNVPYVYDKKPLILTKSYYDNPSAYPKFDNFDAINVDKVADIPMDYDGIMAVPITFLNNYYPSQFEIIDINPHFFSIVEQGLPKPKQLTLHNVGKKDPYARILIKKKDDLTPTPTQFEIIGLMSGAKDSSLINGNDGRAKFYINGKGVYARILIRKIRK